MKNTIIASYSEYEKCGYTIEDYYEYCLDNDDIEEGMTKEEFIIKFEDSNEFWEWTNYEWECCWEDYLNDVCYEADKILEIKDFVKVSGSMGLWYGRRGVDKIVRETSLRDIISKYINPDMIEIDVYQDRVEVKNIHHDGTNYYEFTPFSFNDLTKSELLKLIDKEDFEYQTDIKLYKATKQDLVDYLSNCVD